MQISKISPNSYYFKINNILKPISKQQNQPLNINFTSRKAFTKAQSVEILSKLDGQYQLSKRKTQIEGIKQKAQEEIKREAELYQSTLEKGMKVDGEHVLINYDSVYRIDKNGDFYEYQNKGFRSKLISKGYHGTKSTPLIHLTKYNDDNTEMFMPYGDSEGISYKLTQNSFYQPHSLMNSKYSIFCNFNKSGNLANYREEEVFSIDGKKTSHEAKTTSTIFEFLPDGKLKNYERFEYQGKSARMYETSYDSECNIKRCSFEQDHNKYNFDKESQTFIIEE